MMSGLSVAAAVFAAIVALIYFERLNPLQFSSNNKVFVLMNILMCWCCVWSAYTLCAIGFGVLNILTPIMASLYLVRTHDVFIQETKPAEFDQAPIPAIFKDW